MPQLLLGRAGRNEDSGRPASKEEQKEHNGQKGQGVLTTHASC